MDAVYTLYELLGAGGELALDAAPCGFTICSFFLSPSVLGWIHFSFSYTISTSKYLFKLTLGALTLLSSLLQVRRYHFPTNPSPQMPTSVLGGGEAAVPQALVACMAQWATPSVG